MGDTRTALKNTMKRADRDLVALGIAVGAILMFLGTGGSVLPQIARSWMGIGTGPDALLVNALLLNIALIIFGWRRYRELLEEIEERKSAEERARILAETDPLTGCLNRRSIAPATDEMIARESAKGRHVAFVMIDLDNFKQVNDVHGHTAGDRVLREAAERITALLPRDGLCARLGGDEFACVVPRDGEPEQVDLFAARVIEKVAAPIHLGEVAVEITISVGIAADDAATFGAEEPDAKGLMHKADIAMYHAKKQGKNRHFWFEPQMEDELRYRHQLENAMRRGIAEREFVPFYEQQIDLKTGEILGFEMLARWKSEEFGHLGPTVFIPVAEEMGLISALSEMLIEQALEDAKGWDPKLTLAVNISAIQLQDPWFSQRILKLLVTHNFPPERLDIEITESCLQDNVALVRPLIASLRNQGVKISLDDFGTGYSSLAQLRNLPFDQLKIDRSFIGELRENGSGRKIVDAIIQLGDGLEMPVTAEGVEDSSILSALSGFKSIKGQGYHYGKPEDAETVRKRLEALGRLAQRSETGTESPAPVDDDTTGADGLPQAREA